MRKKMASGVIAVLSMILMTGCGNAIPEMSAEQQELVVEYAANTLLKYDKYYERKLIELTLEQEMADNAAETEDTDEDEKNADASKEESTLKPDPEVAIVDNTGEAMSENISIEKFLGLDSVEITYTGYETGKTYPDQGEDLFFIMNSTEGKELLILKFQAKNVSETETELDIAQSETRFKIVVDGKQQNALTTMLLNDMAYYAGTIAAGGEEELVLICEVPEEEAGKISELGLVRKNVENTATISLN